MATGDTKSSRGYGGRGGGGYSFYDDEGRGLSKVRWEEFKLKFESSGFDCTWLFTLSDEWIYVFRSETTNRYGISDSPRVWNAANYANDSRCDSDWLDERHSEDDSRVARLVKQECGDDVWLRFSKFYSEAYYRHKVKLDAERLKRNERERIRYNSRREQEDAKRIQEREQETRSIRGEVSLNVGMLFSDLAEVFRWKESFGQRNGDWLDDPVEAVAIGYGFGEEIRVRSGTKLQVTVSLDLSNSMENNGIADQALATFRTIYLTLESIQCQFQNDLFIAPFYFSRGKDGRMASLIVDSRYDSGNRDEFDLGVMEEWRKIGKFPFGNTWGVSFSGEDTWFYPLFQSIMEWEDKYSDPGAMRLDIIITDAVLEHVTDVRKSSEIQERRNGSLQTVLLNLLPPDRWVNSSLPLRCVQYPANSENLGGLLRNVLADFCAMYL